VLLIRVKRRDSKRPWLSSKKRRKLSFGEAQIQKVSAEVETRKQAPQILVENP